MLPCAPVWAADPKEPSTALDQNAFARPELRISRSHAVLDEVLGRPPNERAWRQSLQAATAVSGEPAFRVYIDSRSGAAANMIGSVYRRFS